MSENREPRISHLTKPRTRTLISSYRPFLESLTRSALTAYYRAHVVNWPSFLTISCLFPRSPLSSITPGSGFLFWKLKKILPFFSLRNSAKARTSWPQLIGSPSWKCRFLPKNRVSSLFFAFFAFFSCSSLYTTLCRLLLSHLAHRWKPIGSFLFLLFPFSDSKMGNSLSDFRE